MCTRGDHRPDELQREPDRARLERRQTRRPPERVAEELLVDVDLVAVQLGVDRVATAAEVDEVEQRQMLFECLRRDGEALGEIGRRDDRLLLLAAGGEQIREQRLEHPETFGRDRPRRAFGAAVVPELAYSRRRLGRGAGVGPLRRLGAFEHELAELRRVEWDRASVLAQHPAREQSQLRVLGLEDVAVDAVARLAVRTARPPGRIRSELDAGLAERLSELPVGTAAEVLDAESLR